MNWLIYNIFDLVYFSQNIIYLESILLNLWQHVNIAKAGNLKLNHSLKNAFDWVREKEFMIAYFNNSVLKKISGPQINKHPESI